MRGARRGGGVEGFILTFLNCPTLCYGELQESPHAGLLSYIKAIYDLNIPCLAFCQAAGSCIIPHDRCRTL